MTEEQSNTSSRDYFIRNSKDVVDVEKEEGLALLLGGLSSDLMKETFWCEEDENDVPEEGFDSFTDSTLEIKKAKINDSTKYYHKERKNEGEEEACIPINYEATDYISSCSKNIFDRSFCIDPKMGNLAPPSVQVVKTTQRGNALISTRQIKRGQIIFSEKAVDGAQLLQMNSEYENGITLNENEPQTSKNSQLYHVKGCQQCFRSMEPASCFSKTKFVLGGNETSKNFSNDIELPLRHLWPVPEYDGGNQPHTRSDCNSCGAIFCSKFCHDAHNKLMGSCCNCTNAIKNACIAVQRAKTCDLEEVGVNPALILACRMFCSSVHRYRQSDVQNAISVATKESSTPNEKKLQQNMEEQYPFFSMCGDASDISKLELGILETGIQSSNVSLSSDGPSYTLRHIHLSLASSLCLTPLEMPHFDLSYFHKLTSTIARNAIGVTTQSPFKQYYSALIRTNGRGSKEHERHMKTIATMLGSKDGKLGRQMDRAIEEKCAIKTISIFTLTCRMNHSCEPSAEVQSQVFVDNHIDVIALRDIAPGEEITISYINLGKNAGRIATDRVKRMRQLQSRYLFLCDCSLCSNKKE